MEHAYAQALWKLVDAGHEPKEAVRRVKEALEKSGRGALLPRVARVVQRIAQLRESGKPTLAVASDAERNASLQDATERLSLTGDVALRVDGSLIGGWRYEERGRLVDTSYKSQLLEIFNRATR
jgi:F0F1-type ATP synthase delta subunit